MERLHISPMKTTDASKASLFFIPYDMGVDAMIVKETGRYRLEKSNIGKCPLAKKAIAYMKLQPKDFFKNYLHDHIVIFSISHGLYPLSSSSHFKLIFFALYQCFVFPM